MEVKEYRSNLIVFSPKYRLPITFALGLIIAILINLIGDGAFSERARAFAVSSVLPIFDGSDAPTAFFKLLASHANQLISLIAVAVLSVTVFAKSSIACMILIKGFFFGIYCGALVANTDILPSLIAILFSASASLVFLRYCRSASELADSLKRHTGNELSRLFSNEVFSSAVDLLTAIGSVIILSIIKSFLLWLCLLI